jgi:hypothetical protein
MSETPSERLISALEREGVVAGEAGAWTLDEAAARRKLAAHRLADASVWPCTIVEAASLLGALSIRFERRIDGLVIEFNGLAPPLDGLFAAVFAKTTSDPRTRAARKLAIAFETMLERAEVMSITVEAGGGRLTLTPDERSFAGREPLGHTKILVRRRLSWPELDQLATRCRYARASILVSSVSKSEAEPLALGLEQALVDAGATAKRWPIMPVMPVMPGTSEPSGATKPIGWLGHRPDAELDSQLVIVNDGVVAETLPLAGKGVVAVVECSLAKDLAESKLLRDDAFARLLAQVEAARAAHPHDPVPKRAVPAVVVGSDRSDTLRTIAALSMMLVLFAFVLVWRACEPFAPDVQRSPPSDPRHALLWRGLSRLDTFAGCPFHELPGGRLEQLRIMVFLSPDYDGAYVYGRVRGINDDDAAMIDSPDSVRCIERRVTALGDELVKLDPDRWRISTPETVTWTFDY